MNPAKKPANIGAFLVSAEFAIPTNAHPSANKLVTAIGDPLGAFFSVEETMDADTAAKTAHDGIQVVLDEWWAEQA
jgi:hypothetical protein